MFLISDFESFDSEFNKTVPELCGSSFVVGQVLNYTCALMDPDGLVEPLDRCRYGRLATSLECIILLLLWSVLSSNF